MSNVNSMSGVLVYDDKHHFLCSLIISEPHIPTTAIRVMKKAKIHYSYRGAKPMHNLPLSGHMAQYPIIIPSPISCFPIHRPSQLPQSVAMDALYALEREEAIWHTEYEAQNSDVTCIHGRLSKSATTSPVRIPSHTTASPQTCQQWQDDDGASRMMDKAVRNQRRLSGPLSTPNWNLHGSPSVLSPILLPPAYSTNWWQGHDQYLVKWKGLPREENIWEPHAHLDNELSEVVMMSGSWVAMEKPLIAHDQAS
ncbi:hypothetical protein BKA82DRAFT_4020202 [Pisolithus tinctorius]|nr:hypothetical protein BKA82DRAFT_4020202 [Pisolithus tinctorius]